MKSITKKISVRLFTLLAFVVFTQLSFTSCEDDEAVVPIEVAFNKITLPDGVTAAALKDIQIIVEELNTSVVDTIKSDKMPSTFTWLPGLYNIEITANAQINDIDVKLVGIKENFVVDSEVTAIEIKLVTVAPSTGFVIEEIYFIGKTATDKSYYKDQYFKITNNSDSILYADGLAIAESVMLTNRTYVSIANDTRSTEFVVQSIYKIPSGQNLAVEPGKSIIICNQAIDHTVINSASFDLTTADYEWYDDHKLDVDNPDVPNLDKIFSYTASIWIVSMQGNRAYSLVQFPTDLTTEKFLEENKYESAFVFPNASTGAPVNSKMSGYSVPNEWIIDAVNLAVTPEKKELITSPALDRGYTYCQKDKADRTHYGLSVRRKSYTDSDGIVRYKDTNNSTEDFIPRSTPSLKK